MESAATTEGQRQGRPKTALVVEGGAMRGAWAAGVLTFLNERGWRNFDAVYAASAGACSAAYFVAGMVEPGLSIWRDHLSGRKFIRRRNLLRLKPIIDLVYLVDYLFKQRVPLSVQAIGEAPTQFYIVLTDCATGEPFYFHANDERIFDALRATASMPLATRGYSLVDGKPYADGGVSDPIPVQRAIEDGATDITVVLTHNRNFRLESYPRFLGHIAYPRFPATARAWATQYLRFNAAIDLIAHPPNGVKFRTFRPLRPMRVNAFTRERALLHEALALGRMEAIEQAEAGDPAVAEPVAVAIPNRGVDAAPTGNV
jgi:predicted patatin/cPLA2 family phospholipase